MHPRKWITTLFTKKTAVLSVSLAVLMLSGCKRQTVSTVVPSIQGQPPTQQAQQDPFAALTIPALRSRSYTSSLEERRFLRETNQYQAFFTSYRSDGLKINALLTVPKGEMPDGGWPAIVFVHGYIPPSLYETTKKYEAYIDALANAGFVIFKIDLRGHGDSEGSASGSYYSSGYVIDTLSAHSALASFPSVNPERIGLWGHSMAGNIVLRSLVVKPEIKVAAIWAGAGFTYEDLLTYRIQDTSYRPPQDQSRLGSERQALRERHGTFSTESAFWRQVAPTDYLQDIRGAIALFHARDDSVVNVEYSRNLARLLEERGVTYDYTEYPRGGHNISAPSFNQAMNKTIDFFVTHL